METQEQNLQHPDRINGRATHAQAVSIGKPRSKPLEIDLRKDLPQVMVLGDYQVKHLPIQLWQRWFFVNSQHGNRLTPRENLALG
jgi:hypothetical protein